MTGKEHSNGIHFIQPLYGLGKIIHVNFLVRNKLWLVRALKFGVCPAVNLT